MRFPLHVPTSLALVLALGACGGSGGGGGGGEAAASADFLLGSTGDAGLFSLSAELTAVRLVREDGTQTANLLPAPTSVEFIGLQDVAEWLMGTEIPPGTYTGIEVDFDPASVTATTRGGADVALDAPSGLWELELDRPLVVAPGADERMEIVLDVAESVSGDLLPAPPTFTPVGDVYLSSDGGDGDGERELDELRGLVVEVALRDMTFTVDVFHDEYMDDPMGKLLVQVLEDTVLVDDDGVEFPTKEAFFASLRVGLTVVEFRGRMDDMGVVQADRVEIVDQAGGDGRPPVVEIEGMVLHIDGDDETSLAAESGQFVLLIREIEEGADIAEPVLMGIGDPSSIDVAYDESTRFIGPRGEQLRPEALRVGQIVDVSFDEFVESPFLATEVEIEVVEACFTGDILEVDAESSRIVIRLGDDDRDMHGDDLYGREEILVDLSEASIHLRVRKRPELGVDELVVGMKITVCGTLETIESDGDPDTPIIVGRAAWLKPGHLVMGIPGEIDREACSFVLRAGRIVQTFGDDVLGFPLNVLVDEDACFRKDAGSKEELFDLFEGLGPDQSLDVKIKGIGSGELDEIVAFEVKVKLRRDRGDDDDRPDGDDHPDGDDDRPDGDDHPDGGDHPEGDDVVGS